MSRKPANEKLTLSDSVSNPELIIGLVGPIGTDLEQGTKLIQEQLHTLQYSSEIIRLTDIFYDLEIGVNVDNSSLYRRYTTSIKFGNELRKRTGQAGILAYQAVAYISKSRKRRTQEPRRAYIVRQFKRPEEIELMRRIYGRAFVQVSFFNSLTVRRTNLAAKIAESVNTKKSGKNFLDKAISLIEIDEAEEKEPLGQRMSDTFPLADLIVNLDVISSAESDIKRFFELLFGDYFITPRRHEEHMYFAQSAALRSSDLSRQVGACIVDSDGEILSIGCNEVPKAGGGNYFDGDIIDYRDFQFGFDSSAVYKNTMLRELLGNLAEKKWLSPQKSELSASDLLKLANKEGGPFKNLRINDVLEFGRVVHAEMNALTAAARKGVALKNATLFCTTYPCHMCARHIVSSGISKVVYLEHYSKSVAKDLYPDSIVADGESILPGSKATFEQFEGVAPERYRDLFRFRDIHYKSPRKDRDSGVALKWTSQMGLPKTHKVMADYFDIEIAAKKDLAKFLKNL